MSKPDPTATACPAVWEGYAPSLAHGVEASEAQSRSVSLPQQVQQQSRIVIRPGMDADHDWLKFTFTKFYSSKTSIYCHDVPYRILVQKLENLLAHPNWPLIVACPPTDDDEIMGALLYRVNSKRQAVAWLAVKPHYKRSGVATALAKHAGIIPGDIDTPFYLADVARNLWDKGYKLRFRPYLPDIALWEIAKMEVSK